MPYWLESDRPKWQELLLPISQSISFLRPYWLQNSPRIHHYLPYFGESASSHNSCKNSAKGDRKCAKPLWIKTKTEEGCFCFSDQSLLFHPHSLNLAPPPAPPIFYFHILLVFFVCFLIFLIFFSISVPLISICVSICLFLFSAFESQLAVLKD